MATHLISAAAQVRAIAKAVSTAFAASALSDEERNPGRIELTDLPWSAPPLQCRATLGGVPLASFLNVPSNLDETLLRRFWIKTLDDLWFRPSSVIRRGAFANCSWATPRLRAGQRAFLFSTPVGFPADLDPAAGAMFSIEVAAAAAASLPVHDVVSDDDSYYIVLPDGSHIGVKDGRITTDSPWSENVSGRVPDLLEMSRGEPTYVCQFDQIASIRSIINVHKHRVPEFQGLDYALQALRILTLGTYCPGLGAQMHQAHLDLPALRRAEHVLRDCIQIVDDTSMSDRSKLQIWQNTLVPDVISTSKFRQHIWSGRDFPFSLPQAKLQAVRAWLANEYQTRIPKSMQQETICKP